MMVRDNDRMLRGTDALLVSRNDDRTDLVRVAQKQRIGVLPAAPPLRTQSARDFPYLRDLSKRV